MNFFRGKISKNVTITTDKNEFSELFKNYDQNLKKLVFGIFTPYDILSFLFENQENEKNFHFYRFIVDEIQHRSTITDVLIARLSNYNQNGKFTYPMNVIFLTSSTFSEPILRDFQSTLNFTEDPAKRSHIRIMINSFYSNIFYLNKFKGEKEQNNQEAQYYLGAIYNNGQYVAQDINKAIHYLSLAANQNDSRAQFSLAVIY